MLERYIGYAYLVLAAIGFAYTYAKSHDKARKAAQGGLKALRGVALTFAGVFGLVGLLDIFVPPAFIERVLGSQGGFMSLLAGSALGSVAAGPPVAAYPIAASLLKSGAWAPAVAAFIVSWTLVGFVSLPFEARTFGPRFALARNGLSFVFAMIIGLLMGWVL
ncbi:MAG: permease [Coriobacteriia bacterium]|nr:permease [Coriobacteriia bacterium]